ncbi:hypothetical protein BLA29_010113 [Euroglyphus maynei]|uniref:Uncharacterized protein n=1 Tax=Euroglyphus maynei TaxID=6958 RepID=A0A1Y3ANP0_EURMA|nr:hypothetical protein BLA29_010113 [Euroglyphus maynei]
MVAKTRGDPVDYAYRYQHDAEDVRTAEYRFVKYFNLLMAIAYLISSIWIFIFIFKQADWEYNLTYENARKYSAVTTWKWWTVTSVILADLLGLMFIVRAIQAENQYQLITLSILSYVFAVWGLANVYLRGSIVCFVLPFTVATLSIIQFLMQREEDKEFKISQELRIRREPKPTMETFLDDHERAVEKL